MTREIARRYRKASRAAKTRILDEFTALTEYNRKYAVQLLNGTLAVRPPCDPARDGRGRPRRYEERLRRSLRRLWTIFGFMCGKRLVHAVRANLDNLERLGELPGLEPESRRLLRQVSAATMDRLLEPERRKLRLTGRSHTRPGSLRKSQIPIRTFEEADQKEPGFVEVDLVAHDGGCSSGQFAQSLTLTDVHTGWTEVCAVFNKAQRWVFPALQQSVARLPFALQGLNADNGGEFINRNLLAWCRQQDVAFTRSRPYRKNDNPYVEQKNNYVVRSACGYHRYESHPEVRLLNELYDLVRLQINFLFPSMKLLSKTRVGSRVYRSYDTPRTPLQRVLDCPQIDESLKERLRRQYEQLNPADIARRVARLQETLIKGAQRRQRLLDHVRHNNLAATG